MTFESAVYLGVSAVIFYILGRITRYMEDGFDDLDFYILKIVAQIIAICAAIIISKLAIYLIRMMIV